MSSRAQKPLLARVGAPGLSLPRRKSWSFVPPTGKARALPGACAQLLAWGGGAAVDDGGSGGDGERDTGLELLR